MTDTCPSHNTPRIMGICIECQYERQERAAIENEREIKDHSPYDGDDQEGADDQ